MWLLERGSTDFAEVFIASAPLPSFPLPPSRVTSVSAPLVLIVPCSVTVFPKIYLFILGGEERKTISSFLSHALPSLGCNQVKNVRRHTRFPPSPARSAVRAPVEILSARICLCPSSASYSPVVCNACQVVDL